MPLYRTMGSNWTSRDANRTGVPDKESVAVNRGWFRQVPYDRAEEKPPVPASPMPRLGQRLPTCRPHPSPCDLACWDFVAFLERKMSRNSKGTKRLALPLSFKKMIGLYLNICFRLLFIEEISVKSGKPNKVETNGSETRAVEATAGCPVFGRSHDPRLLLQVGCQGG